MLTDELEKSPESEKELEIIRSDNWELPVCNLGVGKYQWRPYEACLPYYLLEGPRMSARSHGLSLKKDLLIGVHGPRGATKTLTISYLIAKKMRMGLPAWTNWPISFYVIEPTCWDVCDRHDLCKKCKTGHKTYYESFMLNMDKLYTFNSEISQGVVGLTELQFYAESRTSGRGQNRFLSYQLIQIRKSALSFYYDVQNPRWADNRFSWSDDCKIFCKDVSKMNYDIGSVGHELEEGEISHWKIRDISGVLTGIEFEESRIEYGPFQFDGYHFWHIFPTHWKVDVFDAVYSMKQNSERADKEAAIGRAIGLAVNSFLEENHLYVVASDMWARASLLGNMTVTPVSGGKVLTGLGIIGKQSGKRDTKGKIVYDLGIILETENDEKGKTK